MTSDKIKNSSVLKTFLNYGLSLALAGVFLYIAFYDVNFGEVLNLVSNASLFWIAVFIVSILLGHVVRTIRWKVIIYSIKPDAKFKHLFGALMVGYGVNTVTPKLGEITRAVLLGRWENLSRSSMFGTVIVERVIDIISLGFAVLVSAFIWRKNLYESFPWLETALYLAAIVMLSILLLIYLSIRFKEKFYGWIVKIFGKISQKFAHKLAHVFEMLTEGFSALKGTKNYLLTFLLTILLLAVYALSSYIGFFTLYMQPVTYEMGWVLMSIAAIGVVIPTPGGMGSYHTLAKSTLVLLFNFPETISVAYAFLTHIISYFLFIFIALIIFFIMNKQHDNIFKVVKADLDDL
ncbi:hypothetical protein BMS3Abin03_00811 [bacterium BMS3Abin03]|nr:hypothetical protein BMS3Abin03_00811 [bacterium BMS3Abin03]